MAKQEVIYRHLGDTGEREDNAAIEPIASGERVGQVVLQRPDENLRHRTEVDRTELEAQKYLQDSDMRWVIAGGAPDGSAVGSAIPHIAWTPATGIFTISNDIVVQPLATPDVDLQQTESYWFTDLVPISGGFDFTPTTRSYNGANRLEIIWASAPPASLPLGAVAVVSGTPLHILTITVKDDDTTTVGQVDAALLVPAVAADLITAGFSYVVTGNAATLILLPLPADVILSGTFERELHLIDVATLNAFFMAPNSLTDGDTLAIWYDELTDPVGTTGRRQSIDANGNTVLNAGQLTNLTDHPERIPISIPICKRIGDDLLFIDGTVVAGALTNSPLDTTFGVHGYMLDTVFGGGLFDDAISYLAWLSVNATTFQEAWNNFIGVMDESVSTAAAGLLGFDDTTLGLLWGDTAASIQEAIDDVMNLLDFPGAVLTSACGSAKIGFDGSIPGIIIPSFDQWVGIIPTPILSPDVWTALMNLGDALQDKGLVTLASGASRIGYDDTIFNPWGGGVAATVQAALDALATVLPAVGPPSGASLIGYDGTAFNPWIGMPATELQTALDLLVYRVARVADYEHISGEWWFYGDYDFNTSLQASTYPRGADIRSRLASPGEGWYNASYGNPADKGGAVPGVDSNYYDFTPDTVVDTLVFWDTRTDPVNPRKMFVFLTTNGATAIFRYGDALTGELLGSYPVADCGIDPIAFCADNANNIYTYLSDGKICKYSWNGTTFIPDPLPNPIYSMPSTPSNATLAKMLYSSTGIPGTDVLIVPTGGVGLSGTGTAAIHVISTASPAILQFDTDCGCSGLDFAGGLDQNGFKIWATFDSSGNPGRIGESDFAGAGTLLHTISISKYVPRELLYDGYRLWYYSNDYSTAGPLNDLLGYYNIEVPVGTWYDNAYDMGHQVGASMIEGQQRFGFDGFNLWFYVLRNSGCNQLQLMKLPVASASITALCDISVDAFTLSRCEVSREGYTENSAHNYGRIFFDGFTLWLGPEYYGTWGIRIPWAVIR